MSDWKLEIKKVTNGYILRGNFVDDDEIITEQIIEEPNVEQGDLIAMESMLCMIMEYFAIYYSKHNEKNLVVKIEEHKNEED